MGYHASVSGLEGVNGGYTCVFTIVKLGVFGVQGKLCRRLQYLGLLKLALRPCSKLVNDQRKLLQLLSIQQRGL